MNYKKMLKKVNLELQEETLDDNKTNLKIIQLSLEMLMRNEPLDFKNRLNGKKIEKILNKRPFIDILHRGHFFTKVVIYEDTVSLTLNTPDKWSNTMERGEVEEYFIFISQQINERLPDVKVTKGNLSFTDFEFIIQF